MVGMNSLGGELEVQRETFLKVGFVLLIKCSSFLIMSCMKKNFVETLTKCRRRQRRETSKWYSIFSFLDNCCKSAASCR